jgi:HNH endonuclease
MTTHVPADLRRLVASRAIYLCEYCLVHESDTYLGCQVDHSISEKHGGATVAENLAYACTFCNRAKGSDIGSLTSANDFTRFFNPRIDRWADHFILRDEEIAPLSAIGEVTARILGFNAAERRVERSTLEQLGRYPSAQARQAMK